MNEYEAERQTMRNALAMVRKFRAVQRKADEAGESGWAALSRCRWRLERIAWWRQAAWEHRANMRRIRLTGHIAPF